MLSALWLGWLGLAGRYPLRLIIFSTLAILLVTILRAAAPFWLAQKPLSRGQYDVALRRLNLVEHLGQRATVLFLKGTVLMFAGRDQEAEAALRESISREPSSFHKSLGLVNLGYTLLDRARYDEAREALEESIRLRPDGAVAYSSLAEVYLRQGIQPDKALGLVNRGIEYKCNSETQAGVDPHILGYLFANRAWALALLGRTEDAAEALDEARKYSNVKVKPGAAGVHYRIGRVLLALKQSAEAAQEFRQTRAIDPHGMYARLAEAALRESA